MGGGKVKRRHIEVWAWKRGSRPFVLVCAKHPGHDNDYGWWWHEDEAAICRSVFQSLTGISLNALDKLPPCKFLVPAWTEVTS